MNHEKHTFVDATAAILLDVWSLGCAMAELSLAGRDRRTRLSGRPHGYHTPPDIELRPAWHGSYQRSVKQV